MMRLLVLSIFLACVLLSANSLTHGEAKQKIEASLQATNKILDTLYDRWQIKDFPNFLTSVEMSETSWEVLKVKYLHKILTAITSNVPKDDKIIESNKFVISLLGSSVTAGHDSHFNVSVSEMTRLFMKPAFDAAGINFIVRNGAMGNNPCIPYDVCVKAFAGADADVIQWEQSFNCFGNHDQHKVYFEQFIRQTMDMKSKPIIVFTTSNTPNWDAKVCASNPKKPDMSDDDKKLLELYDGGKGIKKIALTKKPWLNEQFSSTIPMFQAYKMSGIQLWEHGGYDTYKCHGPYTAGWGCCSASWHPSVLGHELRASHYAFTWLAVYKDALEHVLKHLNDNSGSNNVNAADDLLVKIDRHINHEQKHTQMTAYFPSDYSDNMSCMTTFHPISDAESDLDKYYVKNNVDKPLFKKTIFEDLMDKGIVTKARAGGYQDFKYIYYGNKDSMPLSIKIHVKKEGIVFLCQPPGFWGKLPDGFKNFWDANTKIYLNSDVENYDKLQTFKDLLEPNTVNAGHVPFNFNMDLGIVKSYTNKIPGDSQNLCVQFDEKFKTGVHVLTIVPSTADNILISTIITP